MVPEGLDLAAVYADTVALPRAGQLVAHGPAADVLTPATIGEVFGVDATVHDAGGRPGFSPRPRCVRPERRCHWSCRRRAETLLTDVR